MKLPGTIHLGHRKLKVSEISPKTASKESVYGDFDPAKDRIRIDRSLPHTKKLNTLIPVSYTHLTLPTIYSV